ncbi:GntR family transcriptional regulator [Roseomonas sp. OT10]|uniref:GntR family transcriptional regulator n=1 Tax=Roseomonas cutis TaxID=2897332 RepID=UPI001E5BEEC2|nr:GntR family transcriptional regulator [Roseomonas sp. OT10]UFN50863.1 GntR family transcriptional regulator [Roseomonas sp. OT10]
MVDTSGSPAPSAIPTSADHLFEELGRAIVQGELPAGSRLTEAELAQRYGVSRAPVREALRRLEERQLLVRSPFAGVRVSELSAAVVRDLFEVREVLEPHACRRAAERATAEDLAGLSTLLDAEAGALSQYEGDPPGRPEGMGAFHMRILEISGNRVLLGMLAGGIHQFTRLYRLRPGAAAQRAAVAHGEHRRILEALAARDGELAALLMQRHVAASRQAFERSLGPGCPEGR